VKELISNPEVGGRAVLAWAVRGYQMYLKERLYEPDRVVRETQAYHMRQDKIGQFLDEVGSVSGEAEHRLEMTDLYMRYTSWCSVTGERAWTMSSFASRLDGRQGITTTRLNGQHWVRGIKLRVSNTHAATGGSAWGL
jgi:phage/plasmid-associated DNA primase